ncbi:uncharacterized protein HHUB_1086 [Halobacterium hubeiense]|uniref:Uncharacterized protein n=1 Tax=Halobacterium hubeiense TaxID=1407499 RepID=A0A0U5GZF4_9EURY|nr:uncharacterized protein HHUB_1086 [Halobacterium hubeiense]
MNVSWRRSARRLVALVVYFVTFTLGAGLFAIDPVRVLLAVPVLAGVVVLGHAVKTSHLDAVGVAILWLWGAVLALSVGGAVVETAFLLLHRDVPPLVELRVARVVGTVALVAVPLSVYLRRVRRNRRATGSSGRAA